MAAGRMALISVGGIRSGAEGRKRLDAGANLIQIHRALLTWRTETTDARWYATRSVVDASTSRPFVGDDLS